MHFKPQALFVGILLLGAVLVGRAQSSKTYSIPKRGVFDPKKIQEPEIPVELFSIEAPRPDGESVRDELLRRKIEQSKRYPRKYPAAGTAKTQADSMRVVSGRLLSRQAGPINVPLTGSIPSDNTLAISKNGLLATAYNSALVVQEARTGADLFPNTFVGLGLIALEFATGQSNFFDPKLMYDAQNDRFVLVFLRDNTPGRSLVIAAFSQTNDPSGAWNTYALPGDPEGDSIWTDYPAIALSNSELFISCNRVKPGEPWQTGFDGSMVWQIGLSEGYSGADSLDARLWSDIRHNGRFLRNLCPVQAGDVSTTEGILLLSNRNFDSSNDTTFSVEINGNRNEASVGLSTAAWVADSAYGLAPHAHQEDSDTTNPASGFDTNDSRILGAVQIGSEVQFVCNSIRFQTGRPGVYHGVLNLDESRLTARVLGHHRLDLGYPHIAWTGREDCQPQTTIGFNTSSKTDFAGSAAIEYRNDRTYSALTVINTGNAAVDRLPGAYERWGDYFGIQRDYGRPGRVWTAGYFGLTGGNNGIYIAELASTDSSALEFDLEIVGASAFCEAELRVEARGGRPPYTYSFNGNSGSANSQSGFCLGDTVDVEIMDALGCTEFQRIGIVSDSLATRPSVFPNPFTDRFSARFELLAAADIEALLFDSQGRLVKRLVDRKISAGTYELGFNTFGLSAGTYVFRLQVNGQNLISESLVRIP